MKKDKSDRRCENCHWFVEEHDPASQERYGICRRYPPVPIPVDESIDCVQPWTQPDSVCGEHTAAQ